MLIRRFEGDTTADALKKVKEAFGENALVLGTKKLRKGRAWLGAGARPVFEVTAAVDRDLAPGRSNSRAVHGVEADPSWKPLQLTRAVVEPIEDELRSLRGLVEEMGERERRERSLSREINELRRLARQMARTNRSLGKTAETYASAGLADDFSEELASVADHRTTAGEPRDLAMVECLSERIEDCFMPLRDDDPSPRMLVGAAGAGKTTTLAKIAARAGRMPTRLVTTDTHRFGGVETLRGLAAQLDLEVDVARSPEELAEIVRAARSSHERIYVDTAGRSLRDPDSIDELSAMRRALGERAHVDLMLPVTTKTCDLHAQLRHFAPLEPSAVMLSKTDESVELGSAVDVLLDPDCPPLAYLTTGQRIPEDLEVPDPYDFAKRVMGAN